MTQHQKAYAEAAKAMNQWKDTNEKRMTIGEQLVKLAENTDVDTDAERVQASQTYQQLCETYQQLCETEMLYGGMAIVGLSKAHAEALLAYHAKVGKPLLSVSDDTKDV